MGIAITSFKLQAKNLIEAVFGSKQRLVRSWVMKFRLFKVQKFDFSYGG
jgi:hypothetical protein